MPSVLVTVILGAVPASSRSAVPLGVAVRFMEGRRLKRPDHVPHGIGQQARPGRVSTRSPAAEPVVLEEPVAHQVSSRCTARLVSPSHVEPSPPSQSLGQVRSTQRAPGSRTYLAWAGLCPAASQRRPTPQDALSAYPPTDTTGLGIRLPGRRPPDPPTSNTAPLWRTTGAVRDCPVRYFVPIPNPAASARSSASRYFSACSSSSGMARSATTEYRLPGPRAGLDDRRICADINPGQPQYPLPRHWPAHRRG